ISRWMRKTVPAESVSLSPNSEAEKEYRLAGSALRRKIWDPLASKLFGQEQVLIVPDGNIALVSFAALPSGGRSYLLETSPTLQSLSTERDILKTQEDRAGGRRALVMGGPDFDTPPPVAAATLEATPPLVAAGALPPDGSGFFRGVPAGCKDFQ